MVDIILPDNLFFSFFLPFLAIVTILFALMTKLKIFDSKISMFISVVVAFFVLGGGQLPIITKFLSGGGFMVVIAFIVVYIVWIVFLAKRE